MLRPALTALLLAASLPVAAESLNYNIVEFSESANMEVPRDTMTTHFSVNAEGKDRQAVNQAFIKKFNQFNKISKDRAQNLAQTLGFSSYKIVKLNLGHIGNRQVGGDFARAKMLRAAPVAEMAAGIEDGVPASPGSEEISLTVSGSVQM